QALAQLARRQQAAAELLRGRNEVPHDAENGLRRVREGAEDLGALQQHATGERRRDRAQVRRAVALGAQQLVRLVDHAAFSLSRGGWLTTFGFAFPPVSFITWPTKKPSRPSLPPWYAATCPGLAARMASITGSSSDVSETARSARYASAV